MISALNLSSKLKLNFIHLDFIVSKTNFALSWISINWTLLFGSSTIFNSEFEALVDKYSISSIKTIFKLSLKDDLLIKLFRFLISEISIYFLSNFFFYIIKIRMNILRNQFIRFVIYIYRVVI